MKKRITLLLLALAGWSIYRFRRRLIARLLKLPPPRHDVAVDRDLPLAMPDGIRLYTDHYYPLTDGDYPTILIRTPYGRGREVPLFGGYPLSELPAQRFAERGYHVIVQGARGCLNSEGEFHSHVNEAPDGQATVAWIEKQPWFNGVLATWGPSYLGYAQWAVAAGHPACLKAMVPAITSAENFSVTHPDGAFGLETRLRWSQGMQVMEKSHHLPLSESLRTRFASDQEESLQRAFNHLPLLTADEVAAGQALPFYRDILAHNDAGDPFWTTRDHSQAVAGVTAAVHLIGGWYDYYLRGILRDYATLQAAGQNPTLTIGPWYHAHPQGMIAGLREAIAWFDCRLKGRSLASRPKPVRIFVMGAAEWREFDQFPPPSKPLPYYLHRGHELTPTSPAPDSPPDRYRYDPHDPTPAVGGAILGADNAGAQDNRHLEGRSDVLSYTTDPLAQDLEIIGAARLVLYVRSSLEHTDFFGRLCDVHPDDRSLNICDGLLRLAPGSVQQQDDGTLRITIDLWPTAHRFLAGHRLRLQVSSGAHPRWSRNLGTGQPIATGTEMAVAEQTIYHDAAHPSSIILPVTTHP